MVSQALSADNFCKTDPPLIENKNSRQSER